MDQEEILVSVICTTYNHEKYIRDCLEGFVTQKTNFAYEVIVHDDASTDYTADIIREYERKYPEIIKPIFQTQNQYSQGVSISATFILPIVRGRFIALCEGDDYWTDPYKLQKQVDGMMANPTCKMCTHKVIEVYEDGKPNGISYPSVPVKAGVISSRQFFEIGKQYSFHTSSYFFCAEPYFEYRCNPPEFVRKSDVGDEMMMLYFGTQGDVLYFEEEMSCYRRGVQVSWSYENHKNLDKMIMHGHKMVEAFQSFDAYSHKEYHDILCDRIARQMAKTVILEKKAYVFLSKENREYFRCLSNMRKVFTLFGVVVPRLVRRLYISRINKLASSRGVY